MSLLFTILWIVWGLTFGVIEGLGLWHEHNASKTDDPNGVGYTLSENLRAMFHTSSPAGRMIWIGVWGVLSGTFAWHIADHGWPWQ